MKVYDIINEDGVIVPGVNTTSDVKPGETERQAKKFFGGNGKPKPLGVKGASPNQAYNLGLVEEAAVAFYENISHTAKRVRDTEKKRKVKIGSDEWFKLWFSLPYLKESALSEAYKMQLERADDMYILHILDTKTNQRTEVRGKKGYESGNYDSDDRLHKLLDVIGKSANISELMNGEVVTINPKHPDAERAKAATTVAFNEALNDPYPIRWSSKNKELWYGHAKEEKPYDQIGISIELLFPGVWVINFSVNDTKQKTGGGDQFKIFATVKAAIQQWWNWASKNTDVEKITFSAEKIADESRAKLYQRFAKQFADAIGYNLNVKSGTNYSTFSIEKPDAKENLP